MASACGEREFCTRKLYQDHDSKIEFARCYQIIVAN